MNQPPEDKGSRRDWRISATLLCVWFFALAIISAGNNDIPLSMLVMATVFFVLLIPAMNDLVRSIEQYVARNYGQAQSGRDRSKG